MSKQIERLLAKAAEDEEKKKDPEGQPGEGEPSGAPAETPEDKPKDGAPAADGEPADGDGEPAGGDGEPADGDGEPADGGEAPAEEGDDRKKKDEEEAKALAAVLAENVDLKSRVSLLEKAFAAEKAETARLRAALADPSFAAAAMRPQKVGASVEAAVTQPMTREEAEKRYSALKDPKERDAFRAAHAEILGLKAR